MKRSAVALAVAAIGGGAVAAAVAARFPSTHQAATVQVGDALRPLYTVRTDTAMWQLQPGAAVPRRCGTGQLMLRLYDGDSVIAGVAVDLTVTGCAPPGYAVVLPADTVRWQLGDSVCLGALRNAAGDLVAARRADSLTGPCAGGALLVSR